MRIVVALLLAVVAASTARAQNFESVETVNLKGAYGVVVIPKDWNGSLFIYAHGYSADERILQPFPQDLTPGNFTTKLPILFQASVLPALLGKYAVATTTFRSVGWYIGDAVKDIENLRRYFVKKHGKPKFTYIWGHSAGGMVTQAVIEYFPRTYDGAMPMCGVGAGARRNFNGAFDLRVLYEYLCHDVPGAQFGCRVCSDGKSRCLVDADCPAGGTCGALEAPAAFEDGLTPECTDFLLSHPEKFSDSPTDQGGDFVSPPVRACFGDLTVGGAPPTAEQAMRRSQFVRASQLPESFIVTDMFFATIGMAEVVHRRTGGKHPWGNEGVTYAAPDTTPEEQAAFNAGVYRAKADASAVRFMRRTYEPRGRTASKVITIHALDDGLVIPENEDKYREAFEAAGASDRLVQLFTSEGGHCGFILELFPAIPALTTWVESGTKPSTATVRAACPSGCTFTDDRPGPFGTKVVERRQKGAPLRTVVCAGETGDCPADATCDLHRRHCK